MSEKIAAIIHTRYESERLPGKCFLPLNNTPALKIIVDRLRIPSIKEIILAVPYTPNYKIFECFCKTNNLTFYMNKDINNDDVIGRVTQCAIDNKVDIIIDISHDSVLITPLQIAVMLAELVCGNYQFACNDTISRSWADGGDVNICRTEALIDSDDLVTDPLLRHHTLYNVGVNPHINKYILKAPEEYRHPNWRFTLDELEDYELLTKIFNHFKRNDMSIEEVTKYVKNNQYLLEINKNVRVKDPSEG